MTDFAPTALDIKRLRRMVNEFDDTTYNDASLSVYLSAWELVDVNGRLSDNDNWLPSYDLHAAAADIWEEKAATVSTKYTFTADGSTFNANQMYENFMKLANSHRAKQKAKSKKAITKPTKTTYFPDYPNPVFDEDEEADWIDPII